MIDGAAGRGVRVQLKAVVAEASQALARLDAPRLEELARSCAALNRNLRPMSAQEREILAVEARAAVGEMAVLARVLEATRANLQVMNRLRELRMGTLEYGERAAAVHGGCAAQLGAGSGDGDD